MNRGESSNIVKKGDSTRGKSTNTEETHEKATEKSVSIPILEKRTIDQFLE